MLGAALMYISFSGYAATSDCNSQKIIDHLWPATKSGEASGIPVAAENVICHVWPGNSERTLAAVLAKPSTPHQQSYPEILLLVLDTKTLDIEQQLKLPGESITSIKALAFDTDSYAVNQQHPAFGLRIQKNSHPLKEILSLYVVEHQKLRPILNGIAITEVQFDKKVEQTCQDGHYRNYHRRLFVKPTTSPTYADILVTEMTTFYQVEKAPDNTCAFAGTAPAFTYTLHYNNGQYTLPRELQ